MSPRGGRRENAGRPSLPPERKRRLVAVYLEPEQWAGLCKLGGLNPEEEVPRGALADPLRRVISAGLGALLAIGGGKEPGNKGG